jgi:hypothetical protein
MTPDRVNEICRPYGLIIIPTRFQTMGTHALFKKSDIGYGVSYAFSVIEGISEGELEEVALAWSLENSFG